MYGSFPNLSACCLLPGLLQYPTNPSLGTQTLLIPADCCRALLTTSNRRPNYRFLKYKKNVLFHITKSSKIKPFQENSAAQELIVYPDSFHFSLRHSQRISISLHAFKMTVTVQAPRPHTVTCNFPYVLLKSKYNLPRSPPAGFLSGLLGQNCNPHLSHSLRGSLVDWFMIGSDRSLVPNPSERTSPLVSNIL